MNPLWAKRGVELTPEQARDAVLAGLTVRSVTGCDPQDPICLHYLDLTYEFGDQPMIFTESIGGWSEGAKEAICEPQSSFYVEFTCSPRPVSLVITDDEPPRRESPRPVRWSSG